MKQFDYIDLDNSKPTPKNKIIQRVDSKRVKVAFRVKRANRMAERT